MQAVASKNTRVLSAAIRGLADVIDEYSQELEEMQQAIRDPDEARWDQRASSEELPRIQGQKNEVDRQCAARTAELESLTRKKIETRESLSQIQQDYYAVQAELSATIRGLADAIDEYSQELEEMQQAIPDPDEARWEQRAASEELQRIQRQKNEVDRQYAARTAELESLTRKKIETRESLSRIQQEYYEGQAELDDLEATRNGMIKALKRIEKKRHQAISKTREAQKDLNRIESDQVSVREQVEQLREKRNRTKQELDALQSAYDEAQKNLEPLIAQYKRQEAKLDALQSAYDEAQKNLEPLISQYKQQKSQRDQAVSETRKAQKDLNRIESDQVSVRERVEQLCEKRNRTKQELDALQSAYDEARENLEPLIAQYKQQEAALREISIDLQHKTAQREQAEKDRDTWQRKSQQIESEINAFRLQRELATKDMAQMKARVIQFKKERTATLLLAVGAVALLIVFVVHPPWLPNTQTLSGGQPTVLPVVAEVPTPTDLPVLPTYTLPPEPILASPLANTELTLYEWPHLSATVSGTVAPGAVVVPLQVVTDADLHWLRLESLHYVLAEGVDNVPPELPTIAMTDLEGMPDFNAAMPEPEPVIETETTAPYTLSAIRMRAGPGEEFPDKGELTAGTLVTLMGINGDATWFMLDNWYWIPVGAVSPVRDSFSVRVPPYARVGANLRESPTSTSQRVGGVKTNDTLVLVGKQEGTNPNGTWYKLDTGEWIFGDLVENVPVDLPEIK